MADGDYVRLAPACHCGSPVDRRPSLGRPTKFCADHRKTQRCAPAEKRVCAWALCGKEFACSAASHQRYCGRKCKDSACNEAAKTCAARVCETCAQEYRAAARDRKRWCSNACRAKALRGLFSCLHCKAEFTPKRVLSGGEGKKYCSRQCAYAARAAEPIRGVCAYYAKACATCGRAGGGRRDWTYCAACAADRARRVAREAAREAGRALHRAAGRVVECEDCRAQFCPLYGHSGMQLCQGCAAAHKATQEKADKRFRRHRMRAKKAGVTHDRIDPLAVFARDGWRCQLCSRKTPKAKRGTCADNAPELDHIVPLSKGGPHSLTNVQCACRACNNAKGSRPLGQLLLIG